MLDWDCAFCTDLCVVCNAVAAKLSVRVRLSLVATVAALYCHTRTRLVQSLVVFDGIDDDDGGGDGDGNEEDAMNVMTVIMMM